MKTSKDPTGVLYLENTLRSLIQKTLHTVGYSLLAVIGLILVTPLSNIEAEAQVQFDIIWRDARPQICLEELEEAKRGKAGVIIHEDEIGEMKRYHIFESDRLYRIRFHKDGFVIMCESAPVPSS